MPPVKQTLVNRQWRLRSRPVGRLQRSDLELRQEPWNASALNEGEVRVRNLAFLCAPTQRNWMQSEDGPFPAIPIGRPVRAVAAGRIVESRHPRHVVGSRIIAVTSWQDYAVLDLNTNAAQDIEDDVTAIDALTTLGPNSLTAYFGLLRIGQPRDNETVVVSGAAGSTGSIAAQIARLKGCRVIGIAGGPDKCAWLRQECGLHATIDYRNEDVAERLKSLCPDGVDVFYDNVGGAILHAGVRSMARFGRIVLCGQISEYNSAPSGVGLSDTMWLIYRSIRVQGFLFTDFRAEFPEAMRELRDWMRSGLITTRHDVRDGFNKIPEIFNALFDGANNGVLIAEIDADAWSKM